MAKALLANVSRVPKNNCQTIQVSAPPAPKHAWNLTCSEQHPSKYKPFQLPPSIALENSYTSLHANVKGMLTTNVWSSFRSLASNVVRYTSVEPIHNGSTCTTFNSEFIHIPGVIVLDSDWLVIIPKLVMSWSLSVGHNPKLIYDCLRHCSVWTSSSPSTLYSNHLYYLLLQTCASSLLVPYHNDIAHQMCTLNDEPYINGYIGSWPDYSYHINQPNNVTYILSACIQDCRPCITRV